MSVVKERLLYLGLGIGAILTLYVTVAFLIVPDMKRLSDMKQDIVTLEEKNENLKRRIESLQEDLTPLLRYKDYLVRFNKPLQSEEIETMLSLFGEEARVKEGMFYSEDGFKVTEYEASMKVDSPVDFYKAVEYLDTQKIPISIEYPIEFRKKDKIEISFKMRQYSF